MSFQEWLNEKFVEWRGKSRDSVSDFALYLGFKQSQVSAWMNGNYKPSTRSVPALADKLGPEIYDVLGFSRPQEPQMISPEELLNRLSPEAKERFIAASVEAATEIQSSGISPNSSEAADIFRKVYKRHGF